MNKILPGNWKSGEDFEPLRFFDALTLRGNLLHAVHPGAKHFRNDHAAVRLLELLDDGRHQAAGGQARAIERVHKLQLLGFVAAEADVAAPGLIVARIGNGGALLIFILGIHSSIS